MAKDNQRDEYLPSPEVCDWLLEQEWSKPATCIVDGPDSRGEINDCCQAIAALGVDEYFTLVLPADGIKMLREDQGRREEQLLEDPEKTFLEHVLAEAAKADLTAAQVIGVLHTAATMMISQCYNLTLIDGTEHGS